MATTKKTTKPLADELIDELSEVEEEEDESVDGVEVDLDSDDAVEDQYAKQPFRVIYQTNNFLLPQLRDLIGSEEVNLRPEYQRRLRWSNKQKSLLIESLLLNVPIPPVFFYESEFARYEVMDGQQRLNAIKEFLGNDFTLRGLEILSTLNGRDYKKLPPKVKRSLDRASISAIVLLQESQGKLKRANSNRYYELRRFVFERLNTGGKRLSAQEIRNAIYGGLFNDAIVEISREALFTRIWGIPAYSEEEPNLNEDDRQKNALYKTMGDCQLVLRFFALSESESISGAMKALLDRCMESRVECTSEEASKLKTKYLRRLRLADEIFDGRPFSFSPIGKKYRPVAGIYDGVMVALDKLYARREDLLRNKERIQAAYASLVREQESTGSLTGSANTAKDIRERIDTFYRLFKQFA